MKVVLAAFASVSIILCGYSNVRAQSRYVVRFKDSETTASKLRSLSKNPKAQTLGFPIKKILRADNSLVATLTEDQVAALKTSNEILDVEEDVPVHTLLTPNDTLFDSLYGMQLISAPRAWDTTTGDPSTVVGVIDTGIAEDHPDLQSNIYHNTLEIPDNGIDDDGNGYVDDYAGYDFADGDPYPRDGNGHGTHCAGVIAAKGNNELGVVGVAFSAKVLPLRSLGDDGSGFFSDVAEAIDYALTLNEKGHNIRVLSLSLGGEYSAAVDRSIQRAATKGVLIVAAAGNDGINIDRNPQYPASFTYANILSVAAVDSTSAVAGFSNYGRKSVDIAAPGVGVLSTFPLISRLGSNYGTLSGTSMATPHVAGAAALVISVNPLLTMSQVRSTLISSVTPHGSLASFVGAGGVLNVESAVLKALGETPARSVLGQVSARGNRALRGASVKLVAKSKGYKRTTATDFAGGFLFDDVAAGNYTLTVTKKNFNCHKPNRINVSQDTNVTQSFTCIPVKK